MPRSSSPVLVAGAPHERAVPRTGSRRTRVSGWPSTMQQAALLEAAEGHEAVEQGEGDLLEVRLQGLLAGATPAWRRVSRTASTTSRARASSVERTRPPGGGPTRSASMPQRRQLPAGILLEADPQLA